MEEEPRPIYQASKDQQTTSIPFDTLSSAKARGSGGLGTCKLGRHTVPTSFLHSLNASLKCAACGFCLSRYSQCPLCNQDCREIVQTLRRLLQERRVD